MRLVVLINSIAVQTCASVGVGVVFHREGAKAQRIRKGETPPGLSSRAASVCINACSLKMDA